MNGSRPITRCRLGLAGSVLLATMLVAACVPEPSGPTTTTTVPDGPEFTYTSADGWSFSIERTTGLDPDGDTIEFSGHNLPQGPLDPSLPFLPIRGWSVALVTDETPAEHRVWDVSQPLFFSFNDSLLARVFTRTGTEIAQRDRVGITSAQATTDTDAEGNLSTTFEIAATGYETGYGSPSVPERLPESHWESYCQLISPGDVEQCVTDYMEVPWWRTVDGTVDQFYLEVSYHGMASPILALVPLSFEGSELQTPTRHPYVHLADDEVAAGEQVHLAIFRTTTYVQVFLDDVLMTAGLMTGLSGGSFRGENRISASFAVPAGTAPGEHTITVRPYSNHPMAGGAQIVQVQPYSTTLTVTP